ncbi:Unknown protein sequence [Pseudomonas syringae pv. syringae]|nr:Unknown protein sequence [Pseudomonas syringae pv. syringae]
MGGDALDALSGFLRPFIVVLEKSVQKIRISVTHHRAVKRPSQDLSAAIFDSVLGCKPFIIDQIWHRLPSGNVSQIQLRRASRLSC